MTVFLTTSSTACTMSVSFPSSTALNDGPCALSAENSTGPVTPQHKTVSATSADALRMRRADKGNEPCLWKSQERKNLDLQSISVRWEPIFSNIYRHTDYYLRFCGSQPTHGLSVKQSRCY